MRVRGQMDLSNAVHTRGKTRSPDAWAWPPAGPDIAAEVAAAERRVVQEGGDANLTHAVAERLQGEWHLPAVREALQRLIPEVLGPALDNLQAKAKRADPVKVGASLAAKCWPVDVSAEGVLRSGRPPRSDVF